MSFFHLHPFPFLVQLDLVSLFLLFTFIEAFLSLLFVFQQLVVDPLI